MTPCPRCLSRKDRENHERKTLFRPGPGADGGADRPADRSAAGRDPLPAAGEGGDEHGAGYGAHQHTVRR